MKNLKQRTELILAILKLTGYDMEKYSELMYVLGAQFAYYYSSNDEWGATALMRTESYWNWYKNQWLLIDVAFLATYGSYAKTIAGDKQLVSYWLEEHTPERMTAKPGDDVLDQSYAMMLEQARQEEVSNG